MLFGAFLHILAVFCGIGNAMALTDTAIRAAKPESKDRKLSDGEGLYLLITKSGSRLWRFKYRLNGKEKKLSIGKYPEITLSEARGIKAEARALVAKGLDPSKTKREKRFEEAMGASNNFKLIANEYLEKKEKEGLAEVTLQKSRWLLTHLSPTLGDRPVAEITSHELLGVLKKVEKEGKRETARRLRSFASRVFRYAVATARASHDPAAALKDALIAPVTNHLAAIIDPKQLGGLLRAIEGYEGHPITLFALRLTAHVFQRPGEIRKAEWKEIDFDKAVWTIPASKMKKRVDHKVPLSNQALVILEEARDVTGSGKYVFPSIRTPQRPMSENTVNGSLRRLGYTGDEMTAHGFRTTASSLLNESGKWNPDAIERALSHKDSNAVRATYNRSAYWKERVEMAQWWSDHLDQLTVGAEIVNFPSVSDAK